MARNDRRHNARRLASPRFALASQRRYNSPNSNTFNCNTQTLLTMTYDRMGRRVTKNAQRFAYNGYLQIANFRSTTTTSDYNYFVWDPTEPIATRPLVWLDSALDTPHSALCFYTHDGIRV